MASYDQSPGSLNLSFRAGDDFSALVDFSIPMVGYTASASITSLVTGKSVIPLTTEIVSAANGQVNVSLTDTQTATIPRGSYGWSLTWVESAVTRTALTGVVEVT